MQTFKTGLAGIVGVHVEVCVRMYVCVCNGLSGNESAAFDSSKQLVLFIANSTRLVDMAECD